MAEEKVDTSQYGYRNKLRNRAVAKAMGKKEASSPAKPKRSASEFLDSPSKKAKK